MVPGGQTMNPIRLRTKLVRLVKKNRGNKVMFLMRISCRDNCRMFGTIRLFGKNLRAHFWQLAIPVKFYHPKRQIFAGLANCFRCIERVIPVFCRQTFFTA